MRVDITNATGDGPGKKACGWQDDCQKHKKAVGYPRKGMLDRRPLIDWPHPSIGKTKSYKTNIKDKHKRGEFKGQMVTAKNYKYQRHHVLPVEVFQNIKPMKKNLKLLRYDINVFAENGICLPFRPQDMMWHDLQCHRGSHPEYTAIVEQRVQDIMNECGQFCKNGQQSKLWDMIEKAAKTCIKEIKNWSLMIHPWAQQLHVEQLYPEHFP